MSLRAPQISITIIARLSEQLLYIKQYDEHFTRFSQFNPSEGGMIFIVTIPTEKETEIQMG